MNFLSAWFAINPFAGFLLLLMALDVVTGTLRSFRERRVASDVSRDGITRKAGILIMIALGKALEVTFMRGLPVSEAIAIGYCKSEIESLVENLALLNVKVPAWLRRAFAKLPDDPLSDEEQHAAR